MSVCHNNQLCVYICCRLSVLMIVLFCLFVPVLTYLKEVLQAELKSGLHAVFISGALSDQSVVFLCIMCLRLTISVKLNLFKST